MRKSLHLGPQLPPDTFSEILPCEQAGPKDPIGRRYGEKADLPMMVGGIAPSDTHTRLILKLKFEAAVRIADYG